MRGRKSTFAFGISLACALVAGVTATATMLHFSKTETIVVSSHYIPPYTRIEPQDVKTISVPSRSGIAGLATNPDIVVGKYVTFPIPSGYPVTTGDLSTSNSFSQFLTAYTLKTGKTGMELAIPVRSAIENLVQPGENIALILQNQGNSSSGASITTLQPIRVLNVLKDSKGAPAALMVFVLEDEYQTVIAAVLSNSLQIGLIPQNGTFSTPSSTTAFPTTNITQGGSAQSGNAQASVTSTATQTSKTSVTANH